jgi:membrane-anchored protein YejM (alkaline phosphatase superfamily)
MRYWTEVGRTLLKWVYTVHVEIGKLLLIINNTIYKLYLLQLNKIEAYIAVHFEHVQVIR